MLRKSPLFLNESVYTDELEKQEKHGLEQYALRRFLVEGDNRFLSGDLINLLRLLIENPTPTKKRQQAYYNNAVLDTH